MLELNGPVSVGLPVPHVARVGSEGQLDPVLVDHLHHLGGGHYEQELESNGIYTIISKGVTFYPDVTIIWILWQEWY